MSASTKLSRRCSSPTASPEVQQRTQSIQLTPILWLLLRSRGLRTSVTRVLINFTMYLHSCVCSTNTMPRPVRDLFTISKKYTKLEKFHLLFISCKDYNCPANGTKARSRFNHKNPERHKCNITPP